MTSGNGLELPVHVLTEINKNWSALDKRRLISAYLRISEVTPGDVKVNDVKHIDGRQVYMVHHPVPIWLMFVGVPVVQCPDCGLYFWVPTGAVVHPSCRKRYRVRATVEMEGT